MRLRRGDQRARKLALEQEKWEWKKEAEDEELGRAEPMLTVEERRRRIREIYGLPPESDADLTPEPKPNDGDASNVGRIPEAKAPSYYVGGVLSPVPFDPSRGLVKAGMNDED